MQTNVKKYIILLLLAIILYSCDKKDAVNVPNEPMIELISMQPNTINVLDSTSLIKLVFYFEDGDGDLGRDATEEQMQIFVKDSRDTSAAFFTYSYPFPYIPESQRPKGALHGTVTLNFGREYFPPQDSLHIALGKDTLYFEVYIVDEAENKSNTIVTDSIFVEM
ncbi:MAG TPA: hypothetical protein VK027_00985 [Chitinophagaceae bacterium]|nr:hypothetical protein [Chitinophagaceae bacterium]